jgi:hypothetical protein
MVMLNGSEIMSCEKFAIPYLDITDMPNTLPFKMFGPFWSVWCKMDLAEVGWRVTPMMMPRPCPSSSRLLKTSFKSHISFIMAKCLVSEKF